MPDGMPETAAAAPAAGSPGVVDWLLVAWITALAGWAAVVSLAYLPLHIGAVPFPVSALLGAAAMVLAPWGCYRLTGSLLAALLPVLVWFAISVWVVLTRNSIMPSLPLTVIAGQWRVMLLLGLGALAAAASIGLIGAERLRTRLLTQAGGSTP